MANPMLEAAAKAAGVDLADDKGIDEEEFFSDPDEQEVEEELEALDGGSTSEPPETSDSPELEDFPENWFGHNIREYAEKYGVEAATEYFDTLKEQDRAANRRLQELAELRKQEEAERQKQRPSRQLVEESESEPSDLSDEELLELAGMDPSLLQYEEIGKPVAQLVKLVLDTQNKLDNFTKQSETQAWENEFFSKFDRLQETHGQLPYDRATIEEYAIERGIFDADALYWVIRGPMAGQAPPAPKESKDLRKLKKAVSGTKRRGSAKGSTGMTKPKTMKEAFEQAKAKHGLADDSDPFAD